MIVIGVTGGVGTGKSTVSTMFKELGAKVIDADVLAREEIEPRRLAWRRIVETFGSKVLNEDETINRRALAAIVFDDPAARKQLEAIVHPQVLRRLKQQLHPIQRERRLSAVVLDIPLLIEAGYMDLVDRVVVVTAPEKAQRRRLKEKHGWSEEEIERRIAAQMPLSDKVALADHIVNNGDGLEATRRAVRQIWQQILETNKADQ